MKLVILCIVYIFGSSIATEDMVCLKNNTVMEIDGDVVLSVFVDADYGSECNISSSKSIQEVAIALFVTQTLNKMEYVPGIKIGLRVYDTCNDRVSVYRQALISTIEIDCSTQYDLGILAPERFMEVLQPLRSLDVVSVYTYGLPNSNMALIDALVDFISARYTTIDLILSSSRPILDVFFNASREAGICIRSDKELELKDNNTEAVIVALGEYDDVSIWIDEQDNMGDEDIKRVWIVLPIDNSDVDELLPEDSYVLKPEEFLPDLSDGLNSVDISQVPVSTLIRSPYLLSIGKAIVEIVKTFQEMQAGSCPLGAVGCILPRFKSQERRSMNNARLYETLHIPATSYSTRYIISQKIDDAMLEILGYKIDATSSRFRVLAEKEEPRLPLLCVKRLDKNCKECINFQIQDGKKSEVPSTTKLNPGTLKPHFWVPIFLTIVSCGTLACLVVLAFILYLYFIEDVLDGNPALTVLLILATVMMLQSIVPFCLDETTRDAKDLNASKIFVSTLSFGFAFSVMLTRALFLAFSTSGVFSQHINGYLQSFMLFFMAGVELAISTMYFALGSGDSVKVMRSPLYVALLSYDIFLLVLLFIVCCFISQIPRNYNEGMCFFGTVIGVILCWAIWLTCFFLMSANKRDFIVCCGILGTACLIIIGILVPRSYFMCANMNIKKNFAGRFESADFVPDSRMNNTVRQALDLQSRQSLYEYVNCESSDSLQQQHQQTSTANYYGNTSPKNRYPLRHRILEPRHTPGYNNYGFHPEMRELDAAYVIPRLQIEDLDVNKAKQTSANSQSQSVLIAPEAVYTLPRTLQSKTRTGRQRNERDNCIETEVYVEDRLSPIPRGPNERYPRRGKSHKISPTHATICEEKEQEHKTRITRF